MRIVGARAALALLCSFCCLFWQVGAGIAGLSKFLRGTYRSSWVKDVRRLGTLHVDHLCIDMNQVLHGCFRSTRNTDHVIAKMFIKLDDIFKIAMPRKSLVLAFDGPAPYAKIQTQRERRKSHPDSCLITPGTEFMNTMEDIMLCYCLQRYNRYKLNDAAVFISDGISPGEGELKIIDWISKHLPWASSDSAEAKDSVLICGSDSDILVQALCMGGSSPNTAVLQISTEGPDAICNITMLRAAILQSTGVAYQDLLPADAEQIADVSTAISPSGGVPIVNRGRTKSGPHSETSARDLRNPQLPGNTSADASTMRQIDQLPSLHRDLVVLFSLQGNDYLPKLRSISNVRALQAYGVAMNSLPAAQRHLLNLANDTFNFYALWMLCKTISMGNSHFPVPLPVVIPDPIAALHAAFIAAQEPSAAIPSEDGVSSPAGSGAANGSQPHRPNLEWEEELVDSTDIGVLVDEDSGDSAYYSKGSHSGRNITNVASDELVAQLSAPVTAGGASNLSLWKASLRYGGKRYVANQLSNTKRGARRRLAELVLRYVDPAGYEQYTTAKAAAQEELMRLRTEAARNSQARGSTEGSDAIWSADPAEAEMDRAAFSVDFEDAMIIDADDESVLLPEDEGKQSGEEGLSAVDFGEEEQSIEEGPVGSTAEVSAEEYLHYMRDSDVQHYLQGILWVAHMYTQGECPDLSYTYAGRSPMTALAIQRYIERSALAAMQVNSTAGVSEEEMTEAIIAAQTELAKLVHVPKSSVRPLSAAAACVSVLPEEGAVHLPKELREPWRWMSDVFFPSMKNEMLNNVSYEKLLEGLEACFANCSASTARTSGVASTDTHAVRRYSTAKRGNAPAVLAPERYNEWTVLSSPTVLARRGYRSSYLPKHVALPLQLTFRSPCRLPVGAQFFRCEHGHYVSPAASPLEPAVSSKSANSSASSTAAVPPGAYRKPVVHSGLSTGSGARGFKMNPAAPKWKRKAQ